MIIVGDIAVPEAKYSEILDRRLEQHSQVFRGQDLVCNFEGIVMDDFSTEQNQPILFNHSSVMPVLKKWNCKVAALANNHTLDRAEYFADTLTQFDTYDIKGVGAATDKKNAYEPVTFTSGGKQVILFNQCWSIMLQHQVNPSKGVHVATISPVIVKQVTKAREDFPNAAIVVYFHWNFDLETLPFPADRNIARDLIDSGANVVAGCHSHCVQGGEKYKEGYIVYGLGNFFVPWYTFINGHISFPEFAKKEMAFEWDPVSNEAKVHFFKYEPADGQHELQHLETALFEESSMLKQYSKYNGMSKSEYLVFFAARRRKRFIVPIYNSYNKNALNKMKDITIVVRIRTLRLLAKINLRNWNN
jgi:hypothetical protein